MTSPTIAWGPRSRNGRPDGGIADVAGATACEDDKPMDSVIVTEPAAEAD